MEMTTYKLAKWLAEQLTIRDISARKLAREMGVSHTCVFCIKAADALRESPELLLRLAGHLKQRQKDDPHKDIVTQLRAVLEEQEREDAERRASPVDNWRL